MKESKEQLIVVVGSTATADMLRRTLSRAGIAHVGVAAHLRGLRRSLALGDHEFVAICIAMDRPTLDRHGDALRQLLEDQGCFPTTIRTVGLLTDLGFSREVAELGCNVFVHDAGEVAGTIKLLARRARVALLRTARKAAAVGGRTKGAAALEHWRHGDVPFGNRFATLADADDSDLLGTIAARAAQRDGAADHEDA